MSVFLLISALLLSASHSTADFLTLPTRQYAEGEEARELVSMKRCRNEASPLVRLDCYDNALNIQGGETHR
jgi:type VI secretion system protein VasI